MKKNKVLYIILLVLLAATTLFIINRSSTTVRKELSDFAVNDTASVSKIFLADKSGKSVTLERKNGNWTVNDSEDAKPEQIKILLEALTRVRVRTKVAKAAYNNVIKMLASTGIKCEIYMGGKNVPDKVYYVGGHTEDALGTFMMIENSASPFITHIPGFNGYLTPRYSTDSDNWASTRLFGSEINNIKSVSVHYANFPENSFMISRSDGRYVLSSSDGSGRNLAVDTTAIENYLSFYRNIHFETRARLLQPSRKDSILSNQPSIVIALTETAGAKKEVNIYPMPNTSSSLTRNDSLGNPLKYDLDRMYGYVLPDKEMVILQHYTFSKLFRRMSDFTPARATSGKEGKSF